MEMITDEMRDAIADELEAAEARFIAMGLPSRDALLCAAVTEIAKLKRDLARARSQRDHLLGGLSWSEATADNPMDDGDDETDDAIEVHHAVLGTDPDDPAVGFRCPVCGCGWGANDRADLEPSITLAEGYASSTAILDRIANKVDRDQLEIVFLPGETDDGERERIVEGVRYAFERAWLFGCPLCRGETALGLGFWRRD